LYLHEKLRKTEHLRDIARLYREEAAQRLYKEWFVDLRFPGYENVKIVDDVPEGWKEGNVGDIVIFHDKKRKPLSILLIKSVNISG
jgi:type I restriction enzyme S subunit